MSDSRPGGCEFDPQLRRLSFLAYFRLSPLQKHVRKVVGGFGTKHCVSTGVRKPGNADHHDMTLAIKVALNPNTTTNISNREKYTRKEKVKLGTNCTCFIPCKTCLYMQFNGEIDMMGLDYLLDHVTLWQSFKNELLGNPLYTPF